jgi:16S rRNA (uracil1498-N3)-methyltransferase
MNRFFLSEDRIKGKNVRFPPEITHQLLHVLRLEGGDEVQVLDNQGQAHFVRLEIGPEAKKVLGKVLKTQPATGEPAAKVALCFGLSNRDKVELILQKATEVGVSAFYPFISSRTLVQTTTLSEKRRERWERIIREAAEQSGRGRLPKLYPPMDLLGCLGEVKSTYHRLLVAWEGADAHEKAGLSSVLADKVGFLALFVGPEGGFSYEEVQALSKSGCKVISMGERILRMETAAIVLPALVLHIMGDF